MEEESARATGVGFPTTLWSQVISAGRGSPRALETLARRYQPVILRLVRWYLRGRSTPAHEPEDLAQEFFLHLIARREAILGLADPSRGRFRAWLRTCLKNWLRDWTERAFAEKRGGGRPHVRLPRDGSTPEGLQLAAPDDIETEFDRQWARDVMDAAVERLRADATRGRLQPHDIPVWERKYGGKDPSDREVADALGLSVNEVVVSLRRTRKRFRIHLEAEVESTVSSRADLEEEIRDLKRVFGT